MTDIRQAFKELALPCPPGDRVKSAIDRASKEAGIPYVRGREIWYGNNRRIEAHEAEKVRTATIRKEIRDHRKHVLRVEAHITRMESLLRAQDADFHSETLIALGHSHLRTK